jgi:hypothetical protein
MEQGGSCFDVGAFYCNALLQPPYSVIAIRFAFHRKIDQQRQLLVNC